MSLKSSPTIVIMADFGNAPYAWLRKAEDSPPYVGESIADACSGFPKEFKISKSLESELAGWAIDFENNHDKKSFSWTKWNERGIALARKLKKEVGSKYLVEYHVPMEDPTHLKGAGIINID